jgi:hypothetical protein
MWGQIAGAVIGGIMGNKRAQEDRKAMDRANAANMAGFNQYKPYVDAGLKGGQEAFNSALNAGYYQGPTLAGPNDFQTNTANFMGNAAGNIMNTGQNLFNTGAGAFGNYQSLYDKAMSNADSIGGYQSYFDQNIADQRNIGDRFSNMSDQISDMSGQYGNFGNQYANLGNEYGNVQGRFGNLGSDMRGYESRFNELGNQQGQITDQFRDMARRAGQDRIAEANQYAVDNAGSLVDAMMRDDRRTLQEQTLPGINMSASGSGNVNSSRAGVADAIANRAFDDRRADMTADTVDRLRREKLAQDNLSFNQQTSALSNAGSSLANTGSFNSNAMNTITGQGNMLSNEASMIGNRGNMVGNQVNTLGNQINAMTTSGNMLSNAGSAYGNAAGAAGNAVGNIGASNNALGVAGGFNNNLVGGMSTGLNMMGEGGRFGMDAGNFFQGQDQAKLNDDRARFEGNRDFEYNMYKDYMSGMLGRAPTTNNTAQPNMVNPAAATMAGAMSGFGFGRDYLQPMFGGGRPVQFGSGTVYGNTGNSMGASYAPPYVARG